LCDRLIAEGHEVICVDNLLTGTLRNLQQLNDQPRFQFVQHDISQPLEVPGALDYVLHFASPASPADYLKYPIQTLKVGALGSYHALGIAKAKGAKFLLASTSEIYGDPQVHPQGETYWGHVTCVGPRGVYDEAKRFAEALTMAYHREHQVDTRIARIFNCYGPRMRLDDGRAIPTFIGQAMRGEPLTVYGQGTQTRSFCYIDDLLEGIRRLMEAPVHEPVNLGTADERPILEIAKSVLAHFNGTPSRIVPRPGAVPRGGTPPAMGGGVAIGDAPGRGIEFRPLPVDDPKQRCPDLTTAKTRLHWQPRIGFDEGLSRTIAWFREAQPVGEKQA